MTNLVAVRRRKIELGEGSIGDPFLLPGVAMVLRAFQEACQISFVREVHRHVVQNLLKRKEREDPACFREA